MAVFRIRGGAHQRLDVLVKQDAELEGKRAEVSWAGLPTGSLEPGWRVGRAKDARLREHEGDHQARVREVSLNRRQDVDTGKLTHLAG